MEPQEFTFIAGGNEGNLNKTRTKFVLFLPHHTVLSIVVEKLGNRNNQFIRI